MKMIKAARLKTLFIYAAILLALGLMIAFFTYHIQHYPSNNTDIEINSALPNAKNDDFYISMKRRLGQGWWESVGGDKSIFGMCYDADLINNTDKDITSWSITFDLPEGGTISELWNANWKMLDKDTVVMTPVEYNEIIEGETSETFGFVLYTMKPEGDITRFSFSYSEVKSVTGESIFWILLLAVFTVIVVMITNIAAAARYRNIRERYGVWKSLTEQSMRTFANTIDAKDEYTSGHSYRVAVISQMLAQKAGMSGKEQENIYYMGLLHDIGKIGISDNTLNKKGKLTDEEWEQVKRHPSVGADILKDITSIPDLESGARYHHERWDGKGYGEGKKGEDIPLVARIICVADAYDAMSSARCYREKFDDDRIIEELTNCSGTQFDPNIVPLMIELIKEKSIKLENAETMMTNRSDMPGHIEIEEKGSTSAFIAVMCSVLSLIPIYGVFFSVFAFIGGFMAMAKGRLLPGIISVITTLIGLAGTACILIFKEGVMEQVVEVFSSIF